MSKKQENKFDPSLTGIAVVRALSDVRQYGIKKHGNRDDWTSTPSNEHYKSAMRHLLAAMDGKAFDAESGLPHIAHALTNLAFELERGVLCFDRLFEVMKEQQEYKTEMQIPESLN